MGPTTWRGEVEPDYFQFYLRRPPAEWASADVPPEGRRDRLWTDGHFVVVGTLRKCATTRVAVNLSTAPPADIPAAAQHAVEVSLADGGPLEILNWNGDEPVAVIPLSGGPARLRVRWKGLVAERFEGLDGSGHSDEQIDIDVWPGRPGERTVLRRWTGWPW